MNYMIVVGIEKPIYSNILKCERSGQNLVFNDIEAANKKLREVESNNTKAKVVTI